MRKPLTDRPTVLRGREQDCTREEKEATNYNKFPTAPGDTVPSMISQKKGG